MNPPKFSPQQGYQELLDQAQSALVKAQRKADLWGNVRLTLALVALILVLLPLFTASGTPWLTLIPVTLGFLILGKIQDVAFEQLRYQSASVAYLSGGLTRLEEKWRDLEDGGQDLAKTYSDGFHYCDDLDLFGPASLFQLLNRAVTAGGRRTLARWLCQPATREEISARQEAVRELAGQLSTRRDLFAAAGSAEGAHVADEQLLAWAEAKDSLNNSGLYKTLGIVLPVLTGLTAVYYYLLEGSGWPLFAMAVLQLGLHFGTKSITAPRAAVLSGPERVLVRYARLIETMEAQQFQSPLLKQLQQDLAEDGAGASQRILELRKLVDRLDARLNVFFALTFGPALLWDLNWVLRAETWRLRTGPKLRNWFIAIGKLEALASLAALAYERPDYGYAEFADEVGFEAQALQHPLISRQVVRHNDLSLGEQGSVLLLSGSNMSGKSTLLRSVGLASVLAQAGGPVPAHSLKLSALRLVSSVRIVDSLAEGTSHFYAELKRLKHVVDVSRDSSVAVLYLLDEVLHGTNSKERFIGAISVIIHLAQLKTMGIVTTHDLALAKLSETLPAGRVTNKHFSDDVAEGAIVFDYQLRDGPVKSTNALRLMRAVGIDVEFVQDDKQA